MRYATHLGCTLSELTHRATSNDLTMAMAFYKLEPFGFEIQNLWHAGIAHAVANFSTLRRKTGYKVDDFMVHTHPQKSGKRKQTPEEQRAILEMILAPFRNKKNGE